MFLEVRVIVSLTLKDPLGCFMCVAEQWVMFLWILQCRALQEYVHATQRTAG